MSDLTDRALAAADLGFSIIPFGANKRPLISWTEFSDRRASAEEIREWAQNLRPDLWAIVTGAISKVVVLDFDGPAGCATLDRLGLDPHIRTGSGGYHVYLAHPGWPVRNAASKTKRALSEAFPGMDVRGDGGCAIFCGSSEKGEYVQLRAF